MISLSHTIIHISKIWAILCLLALSCVVESCSHDSDLHSALDKAKERCDERDFDGLQSELLKAEALLTEDTPVSDKELIERLKGWNYYELRVMDKAKNSLQKALDYSIQMADTSLIIANSFNLGLCCTDADEAISLYQNVIELSENNEKEFVPQALEKLAQVYVFNKDFVNAKRALDRASELVETNSSIYKQIEFTQCELWLAEDSLHAALAAFRSIPSDSCSMVGKLLRSQHIFSILCDLGDYKSALAYRDSVQLFSDSIKSIDGSDRIQRIEETFNRNMEKEQERFNTLLYSSLGILTAIAIVLFFTLRNLRLRRREVDLTNRIAELNVKLSELQPKEDAEESPAHSTGSDSVQHLIMEKFSLSLEMLKMQTQYDILKKLILMREFGTENKQEIKNVLAEIIGRFSDACSSLRQTVPAMTNDDCLLCSMSFCGCSKEVISAMLGASEDAVRRRKSRIKQKLSESLFSFFFK